MPNLFAYAMLLLWPLIARAIFQRMPLAPALCVSMVAAFLLLPSQVSINLPMLPTYDRDLAAVLGALMGLAAAGGRDATGRKAAAMDVLPGWLPKGWPARILLLILILTPMVTAYHNLQPILHVSGKIIQANTLYDGLSFAQTNLVMVAPMLIARRYLHDPAGHRALLIAMAGGALIYTIPMLFEIRFSPQLHRMVYGIFPHDSFAQVHRGGGFRPQVFLQHGLWLATFMFMAVVAVAALWRNADKRGRRPADAWRDPSRMMAAMLWMLLMLMLSKSLGSALLAGVFGGAVLLMGTRAQVVFAGITGLFVMLYPMLRFADLAPVDKLASFIQSIDATRAESLLFRIRNEDALLERVAEREWFGWGPWGRQLLYHETTSQRLTTVDGVWIIILGRNGLFGFIGLFGLLALPLLGAIRRLRYDVSPWTAALCCILAGNLLDLLLNASNTTLLWLCAGAVLGRVEAVIAAPATRRAAPATRRAPAPVGARAGGRGAGGRGGAAQPTGHVAPEAPAAPARGTPGVVAPPKRTGPVRPTRPVFGGAKKNPPPPRPQRGK
jgi:hypothetical protein